MLEREDLPDPGLDRFGTRARSILRYKLVAGPRVVYYTFELTPDGKVARFLPQEG